MVVFEIYGDSNVARSWKAVASESDCLKLPNNFVSVRPFQPSLIFEVRPTAYTRVKHVKDALHG